MIASDQIPYDILDGELEPYIHTDEFPYDLELDLPGHQETPAIEQLREEHDNGGWEVHPWIIH